MGCQFITLSYHPLPWPLCQPELLQLNLSGWEGGAGQGTPMLVPEWLEGSYPHILVSFVPPAQALLSSLAVQSS